MDSESPDQTARMRTVRSGLSQSTFARSHFHLAWPNLIFNTTYTPRSELIVRHKNKAHVRATLEIDEISCLGEIQWTNQILKINSITNCAKRLQTGTLCCASARLISSQNSKLDSTSPIKMWTALEESVTLGASNSLHSNMCLFTAVTHSQTGKNSTMFLVVWTQPLKFLYIDLRDLAKTQIRKNEIRLKEMLKMRTIDLCNFWLTLFEKGQTAGNAKLCYYVLDYDDPNQLLSCKPVSRKIGYPVIQRVSAKPLTKLCGCWIWIYKFHLNWLRWLVKRHSFTMVVMPR